MHLTINIDIKRSHALILSTLLFIIVIGIAADYASSAGSLTQWHPLSEIAVDGIRIESTTSPGKINASYIEGGGSGQWLNSGSDIYYNAGKVGIGIMGPGAKLDVEQNTNSGTVLILKSGGGGDTNQGGQIQMTNTNPGVPTPNKYLRVDSAGSFSIVNSAYSAGIFGVSDSGTVSIPGSVVIGTTDLGTSKLKVVGTIESTSGGFKFPDGNVQTNAGLSRTALPDPSINEWTNEIRADDLSFATYAETSANLGVTKTLQYDLTSPRSIVLGVEMSRIGDGGSYGSLKADVSPDGVTWYTIAYDRGWTGAESHLSATYAGLARYIRFQLNLDTNLGTVYGRIREVTLIY